MTDAELIRKQAERIIELETVNKSLTELWNKSAHDWHTADVQLHDANQKLSAIEREVNTYQFDSATNLQNKIKTILMSETGIEEHQD